MKNEIEVVNYSNSEYIKLFVVKMFNRVPHSHNDYEINIILDGNIKFTSFNKNILAQKGNIIIWNPGVVHELVSKDGALCLCLQFSPEYFKQLNIKYSFLFEDQIVTNTKSHNLSAFMANVYNLALSYYSLDNIQNIQTYGYFNLAIYNLLNNVQYQTVDILKFNNTYNTRISFLLDYIQKNYNKKITLQEISTLLRLSPKYLSNFFIENIGSTFEEVLKKTRLNKAISLMNEGNMKLIDICYESGFSDYKYMKRAFYETYNCTPKEFKNSINRKSILTHSQEYIYPSKDSISIVDNYKELFV